METRQPTMKAVRMHRYGGPEVLVYEDVPRPGPGPGEVLVRVRAAGVNPVDWQTLKGEGAASLLGRPLPVIVGWDVAGTVEAVGPDTDGIGRGDEVFGMVRFPKEGGAYAEYVAAPAADLVLKPAALDHIRAAALPLAALTAWQALFDAADVRSGQTVLIHRAAGGVGHLAVQLAAWAGATVVGTASARNADYLRRLGAHQVVDYTTTRFEDACRDIDVVLDAVGGDTRDRSWGVLREGGILVSLRGEPSPPADTRAVRGLGVTVHRDGGQLARIAELVEGGCVTPTVETVLPLADARRAHELSETGRTRGKIVLRVDP